MGVSSRLRELRRDRDMRCWDAERLRDDAMDLIELILPDWTILSVLAESHQLVAGRADS